MVIEDPAKVGEDILPFEVGYLSEFYKKKAEVELHETPENLVECKKQLKEMIKLDKKLMHIDFMDDFLLMYLRARKFDVERTLLAIQTFVSWTRKYPEAYTNFKYEVVVKSFKDKFISILPWRCQDGSTLILVELDNWRPDNFSLLDLKQSMVVIFLQALHDPMTQVNGFKVIFDVKSSSLRLLRYFTPPNLYLLCYGTQECVPGRFKEIHMVNDSIAFKAAWLIGKHFLSEKVRNRIHFHSSKTTLVDFFPRAVLPVNYGGVLEDYDQSEWLKKVMTPQELEKLGGGVVRELQT